jgi:hypothetical protein
MYLFYSFYNFLKRVLIFSVNLKIEKSLSKLSKKIPKIQIVQKRYIIIRINNSKRKKDANNL